MTTIEKERRYLILAPQRDKYESSLIEHEALLVALERLPEEMVLGQVDMGMSQFGQVKGEKNVLQRKVEVKEVVIILKERVSSLQGEIDKLFGETI